MTVSSEHVMPNWLARQALSNPNQIALETTDDQLSYQQLFKETCSLTRTFKSYDLQQGDRVALIVKRGRRFVVTVHAMIQLGVILVPINWRLSASEIHWQLNDADVKLICFDSGCAQLVQQIEDEFAIGAGALQNREVDISSTVKPGAQSMPAIERSLAVRFVNIDEDVDWASFGEANLTDVFEPQPIQLSKVHALVYTSGTTGNPKGVMITYGNHWWSAMGSALQFGNHLNDKWLIPMPLFHVGGLAVIMRSVIYGTTAVVHDGFDEATVMHSLQTQGVTMLSVVPAMLTRLIEFAERQDTPDSPTEPFGSTLRLVLLGGSAIPNVLLDKCRDLDIPVASSYGLTEANSQVCSLPPEEQFAKLGSAGRPLFPTEVAIWKEGAFAAPCTEGEIVVRGPTVTIGYWNRPDATERTIQNGWLFTGDIGYVDETGYLYVLDRRTDLIISGGENVYPAEVEAVLLSCKGLVQAGVTGVPDEIWGEVPAAFLCRSDDSVTAEDVLTYAKEHLAKYKVPRYVYFVEKLPRNASGKLLRRTLKTWATQFQSTSMDTNAEYSTS